MRKSTVGCEFARLPQGVGAGLYRELTANGDRWLVNGRWRFAVTRVGEKARKLKTVIQSEIPALKSIWVESRVVLTATATNSIYLLQNSRSFGACPSRLK